MSGKKIIYIESSYCNLLFRDTTILYLYSVFIVKNKGSKSSLITFLPQSCMPNMKNFFKLYCFIVLASLLIENQFTYLELH